MRARSFMALATATVVAASVLLGVVPASANSASFANPTTAMDTGTLHVTSVDIDYTRTSLVATFHTQNFAGSGFLAQIYVSDGTFSQDSGKVLFVAGQASTGPAAENVFAGTGTNGVASAAAGPANGITVTSSVPAQTFVVTIPSSQIFWTGGVYVGGVIAQTASGQIAYAFQSYDVPSATVLGFGPVVPTALSTITTVSLTSSTQVYGSNPAVVVATVSPASAGTVSLMEGTTVLTSSPVTNGTAVLVLPAKLPTGSHSLSVQFTPVDATIFAPSTSVAVGVTVVSSAKATTTTVKLSKKSQVSKKKSAKVSVTVSGKASGTVAIYDGKKKLKTVSLKKGKATYTLSKTLKSGTHKIKAVYTPTDKEAFKASTSKIVKLTVKKK